LEAESWFASPEEVPRVDPADLRKVWNLYREIEHRHGKNCAVGADLLEKICSPGADVIAIGYRTGQLSLLCMMNLLHFQDGVPDDRMFEIAANFPMKRMQPGVIHQSPPFDVEEFIRRIESKPGS